MDPKSKRIDSNNRYYAVLGIPPPLLPLSPAFSSLKKSHFMGIF